MASFSWPSTGSDTIAQYATFSAFPAASTAANTFAIALDTDILYFSNGTSWIVIGGSGAVLSVGAFGSTPNADGLSIASNVLNMQPADGTHPGGVSIASQTFAGQKTFSTGLTGTLTGAASLNVLTSALGNFTDSTSAADGITVTGGTGATVGNVSIAQAKAATSQSGYLSATDWNTFNGKQAAGSYITALTGDVTASGPGSAAASLVATSNSTLTTLSGLTTASALVTVGTIGTGTWAGTTIAIAHGGTGQTSASAAFNALSPMTTGGDLIYGGASGAGTRLANGTAGQVLTSAGTTLAPTWATPATGTVTSVGLSVPTFLSVSGSPITSSGTLAVTLSGTALPAANGGTGQTSLNSTVFTTLWETIATTGGDLIYGGASGAPTRLANGTAGQVLQSNGTTLAPSWVAAGTGTVTSVAISVPGTSIFGTSGSPVTTSGTLGLTTTGTSGGIPYFSSTSALSSSALLTASQVVIGGGAGTAPSTLAAGSAGQVLEMVSGAPAWTTLTAPTKQLFTAAPGTATGYVFDIATPTTAPTAGATYTNNSVTYTVIGTTTDGSYTLLWTTVSGNQTFSGTTLTKTGGTGDSSITFVGTTTASNWVPQKLGTYTTPAGATWLKITTVGAGGGGGGTASAASGSGAGSGGGGAGACEKWISSPAATYYYTLGIAGAGGTSGNNTGMTGGPSALGSGTTFFVALGGNGGPGSASTVTFPGVSAGIGGAAGQAFGGDLNSGGGLGVSGIEFSITSAMGGAGGASAWGGGGGPVQPNNGGQAGSNYGGGGGGGVQVSNGGAQTGGAGATGFVLIEEFYQ